MKNLSRIFSAIIPLFIFLGCAAGRTGVPTTRGDVAEVKRLLADGAYVNAKDGNGFTALMTASVNGHKEVVELLLAKGADVNYHFYSEPVKPYYTSALSLAAENGHRDVVELLLAKGANDDFSAMMVACRNGHRDIVELMRAKGPTVNTKVMNGTNVSMAYFLQEASERDQKDIVELLLATGADVDAKDHFGGTALIAASSRGRKDIVELLLARGADVNAKACVTSSMVVNGVLPKPYCHTALILAAQYGHKEIVELLITAGADVNAKTGGDGSRTALRVASQYGHKDIMDLLRRAGAKE